MPRIKGMEWEHVVVVGDQQKRNLDMVCKYCGVQFSGGVGRIRTHLTGEISAGGGIRKCILVPKEIEERFSKGKQVVNAGPGTGQVSATPANARVPQMRSMSTIPELLAQQQNFNQDLKGDGTFLEAQVKSLEKEKAQLKEQLAFLQTWRNYPATDGQTSVPDVEIVAVDGVAIKSHKTVLEARSNIFIGSPLSAAHVKNVAELEPIYMGISSQAVQAFVKFLYTGSLEKADLEYHSLELLWASEMYHVEYMGKICREYNDQSELNIANLIDGYEVTSKNAGWEILKESLILDIFQNHKDFFETTAYSKLKSRDLVMAIELCEDVCRMNAEGNALAIVEM